MPFCRFLPFLLFCACSTLAYAAEPALRLDRSPAAYGLPLVIAQPPGWNLEWVANQAPTILKLSKPGFGGTLTVVVMAAKLPENDVARNTDQLMTEEFLKSLDLKFNATRHERVRLEFWNGARFELQPPSDRPDLAEMIGTNWVMVSDGYLVQFQCFYGSNTKLPESVQKSGRAAIDWEFEQILRSVSRELKSKIY